MAEFHAGDYDTLVRLGLSDLRYEHNSQFVLARVIYHRLVNGDSTLAELSITIKDMDDDVTEEQAIELLSEYWLESESTIFECADSLRTIYDEIIAREWEDGYLVSEYMHDALFPNSYIQYSTIPHEETHPFIINGLNLGIWLWMIHTRWGFPPPNLFTMTK